MEETVGIVQKDQFIIEYEEEDLPPRYHWTIDLLIQLVKTKPLPSFLAEEGTRLMFPTSVYSRQGL